MNEPVDPNVNEPEKETPPAPTEASTDAPEVKPPTSRRQIKIGSQRQGDTAAIAMRARPQSVVLPSVTDEGTAAPSSGPSPSPPVSMPVAPPAHYPPPRLDSQLTPEMEEELNAALGGASIDELLVAESATAAVELAEDARVQGTVLSIRGDDVFVDLGGPHQGIVSAKQFDPLPETGTALEVVVRNFDANEGIYQLVVPGATVDVSGWEELEEGMVVEALVTGHNKGGLECEVNRLRAFIPMSQVSLYRVEDVEPLVGQRFTCVATEVNRGERNLVLSRRAILERERNEAKEKMIAELKVGQLREGVVRNLQPFGAFVDLGGIDGLVHVSQMSWDRVQHPSEVLEVGQTIEVQVAKIDLKTGKIGLSYRDTFENPWTGAEQKFPSSSTVRGTVTRLADFGAFVRLEPGIEGLIHISELAHRRVMRSGDIVSEGQEVDVQILQVDAEAQRISLSLKALEAAPQKSPKTADEDLAVETPKFVAKKQAGGLRGGTNRASDGDKFGLKW